MLLCTGALVRFAAVRCRWMVRVSEGAAAGLTLLCATLGPQRSQATALGSTCCGRVNQIGALRGALCLRLSRRPPALSGVPGLIPQQGHRWAPWGRRRRWQGVCARGSRLLVLGCLDMKAS